MSFETHRHSVPFRYVGQPVEVQGAADRVLICHDGKLIVSHPLQEDAKLHERPDA